MDSPVSAFVIYNNNKKTKKQAKKKNAPKNSSSPKPSKELSDVVMMKLAQKVKQTHKKDNKNIAKKKLHKKKKNKEPVQLGAKLDKKVKKNIKSEHKNIPVLIPVPSEPQCDEENDQRSDNGSFEFIPVETDSVEEGLKVFKWMIAPYDPNDFLNRVWETKPLHIARNKPKYYTELISTHAIDKMLRNDNIQFTKNIDITSYANGKRETLNPEGRAHPYLVWDYYVNGNSIRLLNPQTYIKKLHLLNATLQEFFNSFVGANAYLTPPDSQGFAPHYDDVEAFILQSEGKKHWRVYKPRTDEEVLPRVSSINFEQDEIGEPILEVTLEAGDMLYLPRGYIHQGVTIDGEHSLHVTVSMYQKHAWADLFEKMIPIALNHAIIENVDFRKGLPFDIYDNFGVVNSDVDTPRKKEIENLIKSLFIKIKDYLPIDAAVDQMNKHYQHDALPPVLSDLEKAVTVYSDNDVVMKDGKVMNRVELSLDTKIRLLRKNILRMVSEADAITVYYYVDNSLEYHGSELLYFEIQDEESLAIETLIKSYPQYVSIENLEAPNDSVKLQITEDLWSKGLIMSEHPLETIDDD